MSGPELNGMKWFWWTMGIISVLLCAGVIGSITTYANVARLRENVTLFRVQFEREMDKQEDRMTSLERKLDNHTDTQRGTRP